MERAANTMRRLGMVEAFMLARIVPMADAQLTCSEAFANYVEWCDREGLAPFRESEFIRTFESIAREAGIPLRQRGSNLSFMDTRVADARHRAPSAALLVRRS